MKENKKIKEYEENEKSFNHTHTHTHKKKKDDEQKVEKKWRKNLKNKQ